MRLLAVFGLCMVLLCVLSVGCVNPSDVIPVASEHVLFLATAASLYALGRFFTAVAPSSEAGRFWLLFRRTLPWHPVFAGGALGFACPTMLPAAVGAGHVAASLYFAAAGVLATYGHDCIRTWVKYHSQ